MAVPADSACAAAVCAAGTPLEGFRAAAQATLQLLRATVGMRLWAVTRASGEDQIVLVADDAPDGYGVGPGAVLP